MVSEYMFHFASNLLHGMVMHDKYAFFATSYSILKETTERFFLNLVILSQFTNMVMGTEEKSNNIIFYIFKR